MGYLVGRWVDGVGDRRGGVGGRLVKGEHVWAVVGGGVVTGEVLTGWKGYDGWSGI